MSWLFCLTIKQTSACTKKLLKELPLNKIRKKRNIEMLQYFCMKYAELEKEYSMQHSNMSSE
uniref:Uncharacterized protein n=1 Tax=Onchocerca volvulus TaxID=6282 RepID=A0A8R1TSY0_ONCVO